MRSLLLLAIPALLTAQTPEQLFASGRFADARAGFQAQLARNPRDARATYFLGRIAAAEGNASAAVEWLEKAVKLNDTSALYRVWLGNALGQEAQGASKLRQPFLARRVKTEFERAVQLDPSMIEPRMGLVNFYTLAPGVMGGSMAKAKEQAAALGRLNAMRGHFAAGIIAERERDTAAAERAYQAALSAQPDSAAAYYSLAGFYRRQSRWDDAFAIYDRLMAAKPAEMLVHASYGTTAAISGKNLERGERELKLYLGNIPKEATPATVSGVRFRLGQIYEKTARRDLARAEYAEAVKLNAANQDAKKALDALK